MDKLQIFFSELIAGGDLVRYIVLALVLTVVSMLLGKIGEAFFGKRSLIGCAVSSAIAVVFLYALTAVFLALGGKDTIAIGSDFDGVDFLPEGLEHITKIEDFAKILSKKTTSDIAEKILWQNAFRYTQPLLKN